MSVERKYYEEIQKLNAIITILKDENKTVWMAFHVLSAELQRLQNE